ncbi:hypothetical protein OROMI_023703 [Orobanche minor]
MRRRLKSGIGYRATTSPKDVARANRRSKNPSDARDPKRVRTVDGVPVHYSTGRHEATEDGVPVDGVLHMINLEYNVADPFIGVVPLGLRVSVSSINFRGMPCLKNNPVCLSSEYEPLLVAHL